MKTTVIIVISLLLGALASAQNYAQNELICPCMLEYEFPKSIQDGKNILQAFGGVPVLRLSNAKIEGNKLICQYDTEFAKYVFDGFGFVKGGGSMDDMTDIPYELNLTLKDVHLHNWIVSRSTVKLPAYHRGCVVYTLDACMDELHNAYKGGFYKSKYKGKRIVLYQAYTGEARINQSGTGFILAKTKTGLYTPAKNTQSISNPTGKKTGRKAIKRKK